MENSRSYKHIALTRQKHNRGLLYACLMVSTLAITALSIYYFQYEQLHNKQIEIEKNKLHEMNQTIKHELFMVASDLSYFSHNTLTRAVLEKNTLPQDKQYLTNLMVEIGTIQSRYDHIRLIDSTGQEVIRVNSEGSGQVRVVPEEELQNKGERYYFIATKGLDPKQIYTSPFDLNIENGKIESPIKPVIRFSTPIYSKTGTFLGIGIINYLGDHLLKKVNILKGVDSHPFFILNKDGYCLKGQQKELEWLFMLRKGEPPPFPKRYQQVWQEITRKKEGNIIIDQGHFFFTWVNCAPPKPFQAVNSQPLILILHISRHQLRAKAAILTFNLTKGFIFLAPFLAFLGWKLGTYQVQKNHLFCVLQHEVAHDPLTELYNRKAIQEILHRSVALAKRRQSALALAYLDIDGLKQMNDHVGHEAGDDLIQGAGTAINAIIRDSDSAARIGGDEFIIIFPDCTALDATIILERIKLHFADQGLARTGIKWSISVGCTELLPEGDSPEQLIARADKMMYRAKQLVKGHLDGGNTASISAQSSRCLSEETPRKPKAPPNSTKV